MRKSIVITLSLLFVVASAFAQQSSHSNTVSVFVSDLSISHTDQSGTDLDASYGLAFNHMFNAHLSGELSVTSQQIRRNVTTFSVPGPAVYRSYRDTLYPVDANISYHFITGSRWKPYVGAGLRYLNNTVSGSGPLGNYRIASRTIDPEVSGGITFQFRPNLGLRFDAKQIVGNSNSVLGDNALSGSVGLSFRF
jgi:outer membrane autotransporter protein